jgi:hypothetical protein
MREEIYYLLQFLIFGFLAIYFIANPVRILKLINQENNKHFYTIIRMIAISIAFINLAINLEKLLN